MVKIRLARIGEKKNPAYRIVVQDASKPRNGVAIAQVGFYDPNTDPENITLDLDAVKDWIAKGAQPTTTVRKLMKAAAKNAQ